MVEKDEARIVVNAEEAESGQGSPAGSAPEPAPKKGGGWKKALAAVLVVVLLAVGGFAAWNVLGKGDSWYDPSAVTGHYEGKSQDEIIADLNRQVEEGMMNISIAGVLSSPDGRTAEARIENIEANGRDQKVVITLDETGEVLYESGAIAPGQYVQTIELARDLEPGVYEVTATFTGYDLDTHEEDGRAAAQVKLQVEG